MNSTKPARISPASNRPRKDAGDPASGPCGSSTPIPVDLRGGPPRRAEDACGSSSSSHSRNSYGIEKCYRLPSIAFKLNAVASEQPKDGFDGDPRGHGVLRSVPRWNELPAAHRLHGALVEAKADAFDNANILRPPVRAHKNRQRHRSLHLAVPRFVGIRRIWTIRASRLNGCKFVQRILIAIAGRSISIIAKFIAIFRPDAVSFSRPRRVCFVRHPRQSHLICWRKNRRRARIENRRGLGQLRVLVLRERWPHQNQGRKRRQISSRRRNRVLVATAASAVRGMFATEAADQWRVVRERAQRGGFAVERWVSPSFCVRQEKNDCSEDRGMREQRSALGARGTQRLIELQQMNGRAVCRGRF